MMLHMPNYLTFRHAGIKNANVWTKIESQQKCYVVFKFNFTFFTNNFFNDIKKHNTTTSEFVQINVLFNYINTLY